MSVYEAEIPIGRKISTISRQREKSKVFSGAMKVFPVESAYTLLRMSIDQLPSASPVRRKELLVAVIALAAGFECLIRSDMRMELGGEHLAHATHIAAAARELIDTWPNDSASETLKNQVVRLHPVLALLQGKGVFETSEA